MFTSEKATNKNFNDINNDAKKVKNDALRVKDEAIDYAKSNSDSVLSDVKGKAREAGKNVYDFFKTNRQKLINAEETAARRISDRPLTSGAALLAAGFILGNLFTRSKRALRSDRRD